MSATLDDLLRGLQQRNGSDLYLTADSPPLYRIDGVTEPVTPDVWDAEQVERAIRSALPEHELATFDRVHELNTARVVHGAGRFRLNVFKQRGQVGLVARLIRIDFPTADELGLPEALKTLVLSKRGLILVT